MIKEIQAAILRFNERKEEIHAQEAAKIAGFAERYGNGLGYTEKLTELKADLEAKDKANAETLQQSIYEQIRAMEIAVAQKAAETISQKAVDSMNTLRLIQNPSAEEMSLFIGPYANNYAVYRMVSEVAGKPALASVETMQNILSELKALVLEKQDLGYLSVAAEMNKLPEMLGSYETIPQLFVDGKFLECENALQNNPALLRSGISA